MNTCVDVGESLYEYLRSCKCLQKLVRCKDGEGGARWRIHRSEEPHMESFAQMFAEQQQTGCPAKLEGFGAYIWYELRDEVDDQCPGEGCQEPAMVEFDVEVVGFTLREMKEVARCLKSCICALDKGFEPVVMSSKLKVQSARIFGASDTYEARNNIVMALGGFVRAYTVQLHPFWWG